MIDYDHFFRITAPIAVKALNSDTTPRWGTMQAEEMLQHLRLGIKMSKENVAGEITTPKEKLSSYRRYLLSDRPLGQNRDQPAYFNQKLASLPLEKLKAILLEEMEQLLHFFDEHPSHTAVHESFGELNVEEWRHLHYKHLRHHLSQFGLIEE